MCCASKCNKIMAEWIGIVAWWWSYTIYEHLRSLVCTVCAHSTHTQLTRANPPKTASRHINRDLHFAVFFLFFPFYYLLEKELRATQFCSNWEWTNKKKKIFAVRHTRKEFYWSPTTKAPTKSKHGIEWMLRGKMCLRLCVCTKVHIDAVHMGWNSSNAFKMVCCVSLVFIAYTCATHTRTEIAVKLKVKWRSVNRHERDHSVTCDLWYFFFVFFFSFVSFISSQVQTTTQCICVSTIARTRNPRRLN